MSINTVNFGKKNWISIGQGNKKIYKKLQIKVLRNRTRKFLKKEKNQHP